MPRGLGAALHRSVADVAAVHAAYLFNLSERGVCRETQIHAGFRWVCRLDFHDPVPDNSTLVKTRRLWGLRDLQG
ncbi:MAG: transposase, partial [Bacillota bacterium]